MSELYDVIKLSPTELEARLAAIKEADPARYSSLLVKLDEYEVAQARIDPEAFCRYILRDEQTDGPLNWAPYHSDFIRCFMQMDAHVVFGHVEMGKTQLGIGCVLWMIGKNTNLRILLLGATSTNSEAIAMTLRAHIESNPRLRKVFPNLRPGVPWTDESFNVERRVGITTNTITSRGTNSSIISFRFDFVWGDDVVNAENTQTAYLRQKTLAWLQSAPLSRTSRNMRVFLSVNKWHPKDAAHAMAALPGWTSRTYPVGKKNADGTITSYWPGHWPESRIRDMMRKRTPAEADRMLFCITYSESDSRIDPLWFSAALDRGKEIGGKLASWTAGIKLLPGEVPVVGVDLGLSDNEGSDLSVLCFMGMRIPEGGFEIKDYAAVAAHGLLRGPSVRIFGYISGQWLVDVVLQEIVKSAYAFDRDPLIFVESVQAQRWAVDIISRSHPHIQIYPFLTRGRGSRANKNHKVFGVEGLFRAFAHNEADLICGEDGEINNDVGAFVDEAGAFMPENHPGDRLMATWIGYTGGMAYMLENQIGEGGIAEVYAPPEDAKMQRDMTPEELYQRHLRLTHAADHAHVSGIQKQMLEDYQQSQEGVHGIGIGILDR